MSELNTSHYRYLLYQALGKICFAIAKSDTGGGILEKDRKKVLQIVRNEVTDDVAVVTWQNNGIDKDINEIEHNTFEQVYEDALAVFHKYSHYLTDDMKIDFIATVEKTAYSFFKVKKSTVQSSIIERFRKDLVNI